MLRSAVLAGAGYGQYWHALAWSTSPGRRRESVKCLRLRGLNFCRTAKGDILKKNSAFSGRIPGFAATLTRSTRPCHYRPAREDRIGSGCTTLRPSGRRHQALCRGVEAPRDRRRAKPCRRPSRSRPWAARAADAVAAGAGAPQRCVQAHRPGQAEKGRGGRGALLAEVAGLKDEIQKGEEEERGLKGGLDRLLSEIPNIPAEDVPDGADESANVEMPQRAFGGKPDDESARRSISILARRLVSWISSARRRFPARGSFISRARSPSSNARLAASCSTSTRANTAMRKSRAAHGARCGDVRDWAIT